MNVWIVSCSVFLMVAMTVFATSTVLHQHVFRYRFSVRRRMVALSHDAEDMDAADLFQTTGSHSTKWPFLIHPATITKLIEQAGVTWSLRQLWLGTLAVAVSLATFGMLWNWQAAAASAVIGSAFPFLYLYLKRHSRNQQLSRQLPEVFQIISRAVRSGQTVTAALQMIAEDHQSPIREEFALCYEQQDLGMGRELALRKLAERNPVMELRIFVVALLVQNRSGGDLVELLDNLSLLVTKRLRMRDKLQALTAEGRMQAWVLILLPVVALGAIVAFSPEYASTLLERPRLLAATAASQLVGAYLIRRIVRFEY
ncbi:type II secretion system F family protein [Rhodopirellula sp. JC740]|uniref:Type II secretion system F family protein n=1 Tax=Rhodopirellula halodulae TaxID=2894198 RepID=A0ABS8NJH5_9BACT|nr:type II secretion system F family protein [Rhodopirellula sp. JC740]MCC9643087.1 type II secretion system F family protein [Rhodopirellula sp. JC740]